VASRLVTLRDQLSSGKTGTTSCRRAHNPRWRTRMRDPTPAAFTLGRLGRMRRPTPRCEQVGATRRPTRSGCGSLAGPHPRGSGAPPHRFGWERRASARHGLGWATTRSHGPIRVRLVDSAHPRGSGGCNALARDTCRGGCHTVAPCDPAAERLRASPPEVRVGTTLQPATRAGVGGMRVSREVRGRLWWLGRVAPGGGGFRCG
jgi:hypothetical protein